MKGINLYQKSKKLEILMLKGWNISLWLKTWSDRFLPTPGQNLSHKESRSELSGTQECVKNTFRYTLNSPLPVPNNTFNFIMLYTLLKRPEKCSEIGAPYVAIKLFFPPHLSSHSEIQKIKLELFCCWPKCKIQMRGDSGCFKLAFILVWNITFGS